MTKFRMAAAAVLVSCGLLAAGAGSANAQESTPLAKTVPITGAAKNGKQFTGTYKINRFVSKGDKVFAVGKLKGKLKNRKVSRSGVKLPVQSLTKAPLGQARSSQIVCQVLNLVLGPLDLNLLGLKVHLDRVVLNIVAASGAGALLGNLICAVAGLLDGTGLLNLLKLVNQLNRILNALRI